MNLRHSFLQLKELPGEHSTALQSYIACIKHFDALKVSILKQQVSKLGNKHIITHVRVEYVWLDIALMGSSIFTHLWLVKSICSIHAISSQIPLLVQYIMQYISTC